MCLYLEIRWISQLNEIYVVGLERECFGTKLVRARSGLWRISSQL